ncbi:MAG: Grx4 family monothiol glutaredoxin [Pseudomonadota bacterium]|nr:Grx4 family monothiol glutaredoxin [Pseudomonadota bacterium]
MMDARTQIETMIKENPIMLFMKGEKDMPMCGFSAQVVKILNLCGAEFTSFNVLEDDNIREGIKEFSNWPTIPQLYVNGEFIGGCDICTEMYQDGELQEVLEGAKAA